MLDENALVIRVGRWIQSCFGRSTVHWGTLSADRKTGRTRHGVIVSLPVDATLSLEDEDDEFEHLLQLREAIDLVRLAIAAQPAMLAQIFGIGRPKKSSYDDDDFYDVDEGERGDPDALDALARGVPAELRLVFHFRSLKTRMLAAQLATYFMKTMGTQLSTNDNYLATRNELVENIQDHQALVSPVRLTLSVDSTEIQDFSLLEAEDFFIGLTNLAQKLREDTSPYEGVNWTEEERHTPLAVDKIELRLHRFCITHRVVRAAQAFIDSGIRVDCKQLNLDLRLISCAEDDLLAFVSAISRGATKLFIRTGVDRNEDDLEPVDMEDQDRRESVEMILRVAASVEHAFQVSLGGLLSLCVAPSNREIILRSVVELFSSRPQPMNSLSFGRHLAFEEADGLCLERIGTEFRAAHPGVKLHVKRLTLACVALDSARDLTRALSAFNDVEEVDIGANISSPPIPLDVLGILRFPSLRCVSLRRVSIPSMELFDPTIPHPQLLAKPVLEVLELNGVEFRDIASVGRFVKKLQSPSKSELATTLRTLEITPIYGNRLSNQLFFDHDAMLALDDILQSSAVLSRLIVAMDPVDAVAREDGKRLRLHDCSELPLPLASRRVDYVKARNVAFLSVIRDDACDPLSARCRLDARVLSLIFEMSAPTMLRRVYVEGIEDALEDDDDD